MKQEEVRAALEQVRTAMRKQFTFPKDDRTHQARLAQLDSALSNAEAFVDDLFREEAAEVDLAVRIMNREQVHGDNEVIDPHGGARTVKDHYSVVAGRAR